jgi:hypothetical protein
MFVSQTQRHHACTRSSPDNCSKQVYQGSAVRTPSAKRPASRPSPKTTRLLTSGHLFCPAHPLHLGTARARPCHMLRCRPCCCCCCRLLRPCCLWCWRPHTAEHPLLLLLPPACLAAAHSLAAASTTDVPRQSLQETAVAHALAWVSNRAACFHVNSRLECNVSL